MTLRKSIALFLHIPRPCLLFLKVVSEAIITKSNQVPQQERSGRVSCPGSDHAKKPPNEKRFGPACRQAGPERVIVPQNFRDTALVPQIAE